MKSIVLFLGIFISCFTAVACVCPSGWEYREQHCYYLLEDKVTRLKAADMCKGLMGYLVSYADKDDWDFISTLYQRSSYQDTGAWIGLDFVRSQWTWMDGTYPFKALSNWYSTNGQAVPPPKSIDAFEYAQMFNPSGQDVVMSVASGSSLLHPFCKRNYDSRDICEAGHKGWTRIDDRCYKVFPPVSHSNAFPTCTAENSEVFLPAVKHDTVIMSVFIAPDLDVWVGAIRNSSDDDAFVTPDGQSVTYLPWLNGNSKTKVGDNSNVTCLAASKPSTAFGYVLEDCYKELTLVCEKSKKSCPLGWYQQGTDCYRWYLRPDEKMTWQQAVNQCKEQGASLVQPKVSLGARNLLHSALQDNDVQSVWFGLKGGNKGYLTLDTKQLISKVIQYDTADMPDTFQRCGVTDYDPKRTTPAAEYCFLLKNFVCTMKMTDNIKHKKTENLKCEDGWVLFNGQCFMLVKTATDYFKATDFCQKQRATLAIVTDDTQQSFFSTGLFFAYGLQHFWIGVKFDKNRVVDTPFGTEMGGYVLANGNLAVYKNMGQSNSTVKNSKPCVVIETGSLTSFPGIWKPEKCDVSHPYVCQKKAVADKQKTSASLVSWSPRCGPGWLYRNETGYCYTITKFTFMSWDKARLRCQGMNSDLLSISSLEEQAAISSILQLPESHDVMEPVWMGAADKGSNFGWTWSDQKAFAFFHWGEAQPDYSSVDGNNCGVVSLRGENKWESRPCDKELPFMCKKFAKPENNEKPRVPKPEKCHQDVLLSVQDNRVFSASSYKDDEHSPAHARMVPFNHGAWRPVRDEKGQWLQISFLSPVTISVIVLRGEFNSSYYVTKFKVQYRYDESSPWYWMEKNKTVWIMDGVVVEGETATVVLWNAIKTSSIRIWPVEWNFGIAIQMDILGCQEDQCQPEFAMSGPLVVKDNQITVSSGNSESWKGRFRPVTENKVPIPWLSDPSDKNPWIQVDFGKLRIVRGLRLQSGQAPGKYMRKFKLLFSETPEHNISNFTTYTQPYGTPYIFNGLTDQIHNIEVYLKFSIKARVILLMAVNVSVSTNLFFDVLVCPVGPKSEPMIANVPDSALSASVTTNPVYSPDQSRLTDPDVASTTHLASVGWRPGPNVKGYESYIEVDLQTVVRVTAVATQGSQGSWVRGYILSFSKDGTDFNWYKDNNNKNKIFKGNFDDITIVKNELPTPLDAGFVRLYPVDFKNEIVVKWDVYAQAKLSSKHGAQGCYGDNKDDPDLPYSQLDNDYIVMNPDLCISHCYNKGYRYSGIKDTNTCGCGNTYGRYGPVNDCDISCQPPFSNFSCGGLVANSIYSTGIGPRSMVCKEGWIENGDSCYRVIIDKDTWFGAQKSCQKMKSQLVDIRSREENAFVTSILMIGVMKTAWIGLNDNEQTLNFHWTSGNDGIDYTQWGYHQPVFNPGLEQHGVIIDSAAKGWKNVFSESSHGSICKMAKSPSAQPIHLRIDPGCPKSWVAYRDQCYLFNALKQTWTMAVKLCSLLKGNIAVVIDRPDSTFFVEQLSSRSDKYWIGVTSDKHNGQFVNTVSSKSILYTYWDHFNPGSGGKCVSLGTGPNAGLWSNLPCTEIHRFVCQQPRKGFLPTLHPIPPTIGPCPNGWLASTTNCYQASDANFASKLTWFEASAKCKEMGATLASFHSKDQLNVLHSINKFYGSFWIGLNNLDVNAGFIWTDQSVMDFVSWGQYQTLSPKSPSKCGEMDPTTKTFNLQLCSNKKGFLCSIKSGHAVKKVQPVVFPTPEPAAGACASKSSLLQWFKYGDYCYYFSNGVGGMDDTLTWRESRQWCQSQGAYLASINSQQENDFIQGMEQKSLSTKAAWIGLNQLNRGRGLRWSDSSPVGSWKLNWNVNEPNDEDGFQGCVAMQIRNGKWNDEHCSIRQGFVCKKSAFPSNTKPPVIPAPVLKGNCPPGFRQLASKCYRLYGVTKGEIRLPWDQARQACLGLRKDLHSDLVSVSSRLENAIVTLLLRDSKESAWLGLRRVASNGPYLWADEGDLTFVNWNIDEPNRPATEKSCVYMYGPTKYAGRWNDISCLQVAPYVCQTLVDEKIIKPHQLPSTDCKQSYVRSGQSCIKVVNASTSWTQASSQCKQDGASLTSVLNAYDLARTIVATSVGLETDVWLGLNDKDSTGVYTWDSNYPVTFTPWAHHQPLDKPGWNCVYLNKDAMFSKDACTEDRSFICQIDLKEPVVTPTLISTECPDNDFNLIGSSCYSIKTGSQDAATYDDALLACKNKGGTLASIHDSTLSFNVPQSTQLWIGLRESLNEGFSWEDGTPVGFTSWASNQRRQSSSTAMAEQGCVSVDSTQKWTITNCANKLGFICAKHSDLFTKITFSTPTTTVVMPPTAHQDRPSPSPIHQQTPSKEAPQTPKSQTLKTLTTQASPGDTSTTQSQGGNGVKKDASSGSEGLSKGETAGVVVGVLLIVALTIIGVVMYFKRKQLMRSFPGFNFKRNFESELYRDTHRDQLVHSHDGNTETFNLSDIEKDNRTRCPSVGYVASSGNAHIQQGED